MKSLHKEIAASLSSVIDPETGQTLVEMGLIREIACSGPAGNAVVITMTTTIPGCPLSGVMKLAVEAAASTLPDVGRVEVVLTHTPPWSPSEIGNPIKFR